ncbi:MAG: hypothetical protein ACLU6Y_09340 [Ruminococcus sp.]
MMEKMRRNHKFAETVKNSTAVENASVPGKSPIQTRDEYAGCTNFLHYPVRRENVQSSSTGQTLFQLVDGAVITDIEKCIFAWHAPISV